MNRESRYLWVNNDKKLQEAWKVSHLSLYKFVTLYRIEIDKHIESVIKGEESWPSSFLPKFQ